MIWGEAAYNSNTPESTKIEFQLYYQGNEGNVALLGTMKSKSFIFKDYEEAERIKNALALTLTSTQKIAVITIPSLNEGVELTESEMSLMLGKENK